MFNESGLEVDMRAVMVYMTAQNTREAETIGKTLVEKRLAACINILGPIRSIYRWEGKVQKGREVAFLAKTTDGKVNKLIQQVRKMHSYTCPCIVALPISKGNAGFLKWIESEI